MLSACSSKAESPQAQAEKPAEAKPAEIIATQNEPFATQIVSSPQDDESSPNSWGLQPAVTDNQGAVVVEITPLNLRNAEQMLDFEVVLNTHSVDLSMDLAALATLQTDNGYMVQATL